MLMAFFRDQRTVLKAIAKLPYVRLDLPHVHPRAGTDCQAITNVRLKDGSDGIALVTGGALTAREAQAAVTALTKMGQDPVFTLPDRFSKLLRTPSFSLNNAPQKRPWWKLW
jgi:hypothetical protein